MKVECTKGDPMRTGMNFSNRNLAWRHGALALAAVLTGVLGACQQEMSRKDKGYSLPSFKGLPAPQAPESSGSSQNKGNVIGK